jgi:DedD protein
MDKALKQRLVGASVLIILAVIVLPMILSGSSDRLKQESRQIELPPKPEELSIETRRFPVGVPNKPSPALGQGSVNEDNGETQEPAQVAIAENSASNAKVDDLGTTGDLGEETVSSSNVEVKPPVTSITLSSPRPENLDIDETAASPVDTPRYLVQVGSFSIERNANELASLMKADGFPVLMDVVDRTAGRLHRVRVGPYTQRSEADTVVSSINSKDRNLTPRVVDLRPADSAPVSTPADPLVRWVVQVGSFSSSKSAEALVAKLRLSGLTAFSEKVTSASGSVYKVRIGPELDREKATELARKVKLEHQLDGFVTTQE